MDHKQGPSATGQSAKTEPNLRRGLITVFTGDGRGKTSAAIGTAVRAAGHGFKVFIIFFMKGPDFIHGEVESLKNIPNVKLLSFGAHGWAKPDQDNRRHSLEAIKALNYAASAVHFKECDLLILDEIISAISFGLLSTDTVMQVISGKRNSLELILTGRGAPSIIIDRADLVTQMCNLKHPFDKGIPAREGIDY